MKKGDKVICIDGTESGSVVKGRIYTVSGYPNITGITLKEATPSAGFGAFLKSRFEVVKTASRPDLSEGNFYVGSWGTYEHYQVIFRMPRALGDDTYFLSSKGEIRYGTCCTGYDITFRLATTEQIQQLCEQIAVFKTRVELPMINGYKGSLSEDKATLNYGCASLPVEWFDTSKNRVIKSMTLDSNVTISETQLESIRKFLVQENVIIRK